MIDILITDFLKYSRTPEARRVFEDYSERKKWMGSLFAEESIDVLDADGLDKVFRGLLTVDAYNAYVTVAEKYGHESLRELFKYFLYGTDPLEQRFDSFFERVPEIPQLALMEIATFAQPKNFCIWDEPAKKTIIYIGHSRMHGLSETSFQERIGGLDYVWAKLALNQVRQTISAYAGDKCDFVDVFVFTNFVYDKWVLKKFVDV